jgi:predicted permease
LPPSESSGRIGCANIANLLLARAASRTREIALRAALGAGRSRVVRQLLTESCVLAGVAGLAGLLLASLLVQGVGATAASGVAYLGMGREPRAPRDFFIQGRPAGRPGERPQAEFHAITADYFKTLDIPVRAGRDFERADTPERPRVAIINEAMARSAFHGEIPLGQRIRLNDRAPWMEIVGVVADTRWQDPSHPSPPVVFAPSTQDWGNSLSILARTSVDERSLASTIRALLHDANPTVPVKFETMDELFDATLAYPRFRTLVIGLFAGAAALLAAVGIFSVLAYLVGQRTRELAVRLALGASHADVVRLILSQGLRPIAIGLGVGLAGALAVTRLLAGLLFAISPWDAAAYLGAIGVLGGAAVLATDSGHQGRHDPAAGRTRAGVTGRPTRDVSMRRHSRRCNTTV